MVISERLRALRQQKGLSRRDVQERTGLLRCYISRVENSRTVPSLDSLEKLARALEVPMYELLYDGEEPPKPDIPRRWERGAEVPWGSSGKDERTLHKFRSLLSRARTRDLWLLMLMAKKMADMHRVKEARGSVDENNGVSRTVVNDSLPGAPEKKLAKRDIKAYGIGAAHDGQQGS